MFKSFITFIVCSTLLSCIVVPQVFAHAGPGPPFLQVDTEYAKTNVYFSGSSDINVPQDLISQQHLVNTPIRFTCDTSKLLVPPEIANASTFRWTFNDGSKQVLGKSVVHTFTKPRSYIVTLEVKSPDQSDFLLIDTVQINVLPNKNYQVPKPVIAVATDAMATTRPIIFDSSRSTVDSSTSIAKTQWDFGDGNDGTGSKIEHSYSNFDNYISYAVLLRVIDANGFYTDTGVIVDSEKGKLVFVDKNNGKNTIPISQSLASVATSQTSQSNNGLTYVLIFAGVMILLAFFIMLFSKGRKK